MSSVQSAMIDHQNQMMYIAINYHIVSDKIRLET